MMKLLQKILSPLDPGQLQKHMVRTYFNLRVGLAGIAIVFPLVLLVSATRFGLLGSMSAYYHSPMRNFFVGGLIAVGVCLYIYRGIAQFENIVLNFAGVFVGLVAFIPTAAPPGVEASFTAPLWHNACAIAFFISIALVCLTATKRADDCRLGICHGRFKNQYAVIGGAMIVLPLLAAGLAIWLKTALVFWIEFAAIGVFAWYWILQTVEFWHIDQKMIEQPKSPPKKECDAG